MYRLAHDERAYIRPSPSSGVLGGLAQYTHDVIQLCQVRSEVQSSMPDSHSIVAPTALVMRNVTRPVSWRKAEGPVYGASVWEERMKSAP